MSKGQLRVQPMFDRYGRYEPGLFKVPIRPSIGRLSDYFCILLVLLSDYFEQPGYPPTLLSAVPETISCALSLICVQSGRFWVQLGNARLGFRRTAGLECARKIASLLQRVLHRYGALALPPHMVVFVCTACVSSSRGSCVILCSGHLIGADTAELNYIHVFH